MSRCPLPKRQHSTRPCLHVMVCTNASCCMVWWVIMWCCGVVSARGKREEANTVKQKQKGLFPKPLFPFPLFFPPLFLPLFSPCLPLFHHHSLLIHTFTRFSFFTHVCIHSEPKNTNDSTSDSFQRLFFLSKLSFSLLFHQLMIQC